MFLDIGLGIFAAMAVSVLWDAPLMPLFAVVGACFALLPDADFIVLALRRRNALHHREGLHYPLLFVPIGALVCGWFGVAWAMLFVLASLGHFIHDSIGIG